MYISSNSLNSNKIIWLISMSSINNYDTFCTKMYYINNMLFLLNNVNSKCTDLDTSYITAVKSRYYYYYFFFNAQHITLIHTNCTE